MKNLARKTLCAAAAFLFIVLSVSLQAGEAVQTGPSYYVSAKGNDKKDGLTEKTAFKTLAAALNAAKNTSIKTITVIGTLNQKTEGSKNVKSVFLIENSGLAEILITGKPGAAGAERAVLSGSGLKAEALWI